MSERTTTGYEPRFDVDYNERGRPGERYAEAIREAIFRDRIEVKTDYGMTSTGNLYIEFEQRTKTGRWIRSGIASDDTAELWMFASPSSDGALVVTSDTLKRVARDVWANSPLRRGDLTCKADPERILQQHERSAVGCCPFSGPETNPTHGVKVPVRLLMSAAWTVDVGKAA